MLVDLLWRLFINNCINKHSINTRDIPPPIKMSNSRLQVTLVQISDLVGIEEIYCTIYIKDKKKSKTYKISPQKVFFMNETFNLVPGSDKAFSIDVFDSQNTLLGKARYNYSDIAEQEQIEKCLEFDKGKIIVEIVAKDFGIKMKKIGIKYAGREGELRLRQDGFVSPITIKECLRFPLKDMAFLKIASLYNNKHKMLIDPVYLFFSAAEFKDGETYVVEMGEDDVPKLTKDEVDQIQREYTGMNHNISTSKMKNIIENLRKKEKENIINIFNLKINSTTDMDEMMALNEKLKSCEKFLDVELNHQLKYLSTLEVDKNSVISFEEYLKFVAKYKILDRKK